MSHYPATALTLNYANENGGDIVAYDDDGNFKLLDKSEIKKYADNIYDVPEGLNLISVRTEIPEDEYDTDVKILITYLGSNNGDSFWDYELVADVEEEDYIMLRKLM